MPKPGRWCAPGCFDPECPGFPPWFGWTIVGAYVLALAVAAVFFPYMLVKILEAKG